MSSIATRFKAYIVPKAQYPHTMNLDMSAIHDIYDTIKKDPETNSEVVTVSLLDHRGSGFDFATPMDAELSLIEDQTLLHALLLKQRGDGTKKPITFEDLMIAVEASPLSLSIFLDGKKDLMTSDHLMKFMKTLHNMYMTGHLRNADRQHYCDVVVRDFS